MLDAIGADQVVLYAEDDESDAFLFQHAFAQAGITQRLIIVRDGQMAIEYLAGTGAYADRAQYPLPSLVLLDLNMPGVSGLDVLRWIRANPALSTLTAVILTSSNQQADIHRANEHGADDYLVKPCELDAIISLARTINDRWLKGNEKPRSANLLRDTRDKIP
jgi:CheY-like chemotaxis protein